MTPEQQRTKTQRAYQAREELHSKCSIDIKQTGPHWGLYCSNPKCRKTGKWISWVKQDKLKAIYNDAN